LDFIVSSLKRREERNQHISVRELGETGRKENLREQNEVGEL
jgi:hypothetical protein